MRLDIVRCVVCCCCVLLLCFVDVYCRCVLLFFVLVALLSLRGFVVGSCCLFLLCVVVACPFSCIVSFLFVLGVFSCCTFVCVFLLRALVV